VLADAIVVGKFVNVGIDVAYITEPATYVFIPSDVEVAIPASRLLSGTAVTECDDNDVGDAAIGDVALVTKEIDGRCLTDGRYNSRNYLVERGTISRGDAEVTAYRVHAATNMPSAFLHFPTEIWFQVPQDWLQDWVHDLDVWQVNDGGDVTKIASFAMPTPQRNGFVGTEVKASALSTATIYAFVTDGTDLSALTSGEATTTTSNTTTTTTETTTTTTTSATTTSTSSNVASFGCLDKTLPNLVPFMFSADAGVSLSFESTMSSKVIYGKAASECKDPINDAEALDDFVLANLKYGGSCYNFERYNNYNYSVSVGTVSSFPAYMVYPPASKATDWVAGGTGIYFRFKRKVEHFVYTLADGALVRVADVPEADVTVGGFVNTGVDVAHISDATVYVFLPFDVDVPEPVSRSLTGTEVTECDTSRLQASAIGDVALVTMESGGRCWTDGRYNNLDYLVEQGKFSGGSSSLSVHAYRVHPPQNLRRSFLASHTEVWFKVPALWEHNLDVWQLDSGGEMMRIGSFNNTTPAIDGFVCTGILADQLTTSTVFVLSTDGVDLSVWASLSNMADGGCLAADQSFDVSARRFRSGGHPFVPGPASVGGDWGSGPGRHSAGYSIPKKFFPARRSDGREGVVWQDQKLLTVHVTWLSLDMTSAESQTIYSGNDMYLLASSSNENDALLLLLADTRTGEETIPVIIVKVSSATGETLATLSLDTSSSVLDCQRHFSSGASMVWNNETGLGGVVLSRLMTNKHQGAIAFVFNATTMKFVKRLGATASHSFANSMILGSDGRFISMDLGDNYPRGIALNRFDTEKHGGFVPYTFKTKHASKESRHGKKFEEYTSISTSEKTYYKWSNDNYCYTEIGHAGVVEVDDGLMVFFSGEQPSLNNAMVGSALNAARNAGFVKIDKDLSKGEILSSGTNEIGGFYGYGGGWKDQEIKGIKFLTSFTSVDSSVSRLKTAHVMGENKILLYWEVWSKTEYQYSQLTVVDENGAIVKEPWALKFNTVDPTVRLPYSDDFYMRGGRAIAYAGSREGHLVRYEFRY